MELRHLRAFVAVAEERHFGRAAERLHMAQPPLSQQIRRLERELKVELFHRTTRRVELAPAGKVLYERAKQILSDADSAADEAQRAARGEVGRLAFGFTGWATYALLPKLARRSGRSSRASSSSCGGRCSRPRRSVGSRTTRSTWACCGRPCGARA